MCQNNPCSEQQIRALNPDISNKFHKIKHCGLVPAQRMSQSQDKNSPRSKEAITMVNATKNKIKQTKNIQQETRLQKQGLWILHSRVHCFSGQKQLPLSRQARLQQPEAFIEDKQQIDYKFGPFCRA